ncbi:MAG: GNAT family N-acetyltransferase [Acidobacteria bacterium]|nr:GNAT family N-acetyltransferase [Acidobacteriota bacterium]
MAKVKVRRTHREELPGVVVLRDAVAGSGSQILDLNMEIDPDLNHLITHDPDGFMSAVDRDETLGYGSAFIRSRQWFLSQLWILPQHQGHGAGEALLSKLLNYGENSRAREFFALVPPAGSIQALLISHGFKSVVPVFRLRLSADKAEDPAGAMARLLPAKEASQELLARQAQGDVDRIDRIARNISRETDHLYWLKERSGRAVFVRQGARVAAYGYGGPHQVGPVSGTTQDAAMCALGHAMQMALEASPEQDITIHMPASFVPALQALLDSGATIEATSLLYGRNLTSTFDRVVFGNLTLP